MTGKEFIRRVRRLARKRGLIVRLLEDRGKGDHIRLYLDSRWTTLPGSGELGKGILHAMCKQLGIRAGDL
ncbi:MAG: type II toxin-antitoxin system HicA family toxin [Geminicoccaceae bacterium]